MKEVRWVIVLVVRAHGVPGPGQTEVVGEAHTHEEAVMKFSSLPRVSWGHYQIRRAA